MSQALDPVTLHHVEKLTDGLVDDFVGVFSRKTIERYVVESVDLLGGARFTDSGPIRQKRTSRPCAASGTSSTRASGRSSRSSSPRPCRRLSDLLETRNAQLRGAELE